MTPVFGHGQLRLYLLRLLDQDPRHGYEVIRALEERFDGMYSPSAGTVYPRLARLEEEGLVEREEAGRRSVYRITDKGRAEVRSRADDLIELDAEMTASVKRLAADVREQVRAASKDLRGELAAAAKAARTVSAHSGGGQWTSSEGRSGAAARSEASLQAFRSHVRTMLRQHRVTDQQAADIDGVLERAADDIARHLNRPAG